jgi:hypothetical protein
MEEVGMYMECMQARERVRVQCVCKLASSSSHRKQGHGLHKSWSSRHWSTPPLLASLQKTSWRLGAESVCGSVQPSATYHLSPSAAEYLYLYHFQVMYEVPYLYGVLCRIRVGCP